MGISLNELRRKLEKIIVNPLQGFISRPLGRAS